MPIRLSEISIGFKLNVIKKFLSPLKITPADENAAAERCAEGMENKGRIYRERKKAVAGVPGGRRISGIRCHDGIAF